VLVKVIAIAPKRWRKKTEQRNLKLHKNKSKQTQDPNGRATKF